MPFRFENMWLKADDFTNLVRKCWRSIEVVGSDGFVLMEKQEQRSLWESGGEEEGNPSPLGLC